MTRFVVRVIKGGVAVLLAATTAWASPLPADLQVKLFLKILTYDRRIEERAGGQLTIGIVHPAGSKAADVVRAFQSVTGKTVKKLPVKVVDIIYSDQASFEKQVAAAGVSVLYIAEGLDAAAAQIAAACQARKIRTIVAEGGYLDKGAGVALVLEGGKPQIVIHLAHSRAEGADYDSALLSVVKVIK